VQLEVVAVTGDEDVHAASPETLGQRPVGCDDPGPVADGRLQDRHVPTAGHGEHGERLRQRERGSGSRDPPRDEPSELIDDGGGDDEVRPRADAVDFRLEGEVRPHREQQRVGVQKHPGAAPGGSGATGARG
jgi:hypothetical protein